MINQAGFSLLCFQAGAVCPIVAWQNDGVIEARRDLWRVEHSLLLRAKHFWCPGIPWVPGQGLCCDRFCPGPVLHCHISLGVFSTSLQSESWFCWGFSPSPHFNFLQKNFAFMHIVKVINVLTVWCRFSLFRISWNDPETSQLIPPALH